LEKLMHRLTRNNMRAFRAGDRQEARELALSLIPPGALVAMGNSLTLRETGIYDALVAGGYNLINQFEAGLSPEENLLRRRRGMLADVYFTGTNALTLSGELVNIDGKGNRAAAMLFGPERVVVVAGQNKIVEDVERAWSRLRERVAPALAKRLGRATPCASSGVCSDCNSPERICRCYTVVKGQMPADRDRITVILVEEDLGL
jgi:hypothetical protein